MTPSILSPADRAAVALYPVLRKLIVLREGRGWQFMPNVRRGDLELLTGFCVWLPEGWSDALAVAGRDDAKAYRCDPAGGEVWGREGSLAEVLDGLTELPAPHEPGAPRLVKGTARRLLVPRVR